MIILFRSKIRILPLLAIAVLLSACASKRQDMPLQEALIKPNSKIVTVAVDNFKPQFYKNGEEGLVDMMITEMFISDCRKSIENHDINPLINQEFHQSFGAALQGKSLQWTPVHTKIDPNTLKASEGEDASPFDLQFLKHQHQADYALVLHPQVLGTMRSYYGFIPLGAPTGYAHVHMYVVDLTTNMIIGYCDATCGTVVRGDWDTPPNYANLLDAIDSALRNTLHQSYRHLMKKPVG